MKRAYIPVFIFGSLLLLTSVAIIHAMSANVSQNTSLQQTAQMTNAGAIKIAGGFAMTGGGSALDGPAANGAMLALKEINARGGVIGRPVELVVRDSRYDMSLTAQIARQFVDADKVVSGIGFSDTDSVMAAGPVFQKAGLPFITVGATSPKIPDHIGDMVYLACFGDNVQAAAGAEFAAKHFGKRAYLLVDKSADYTVLLAGYFTSSLKELGGDVVLEDSYTDNTTNISKQIADLKNLSKQPDFYYIAAMPYNAGTVIEQFRNAGLVGPIVGGDGYDTPDILKLGGNASDNVFFSTHALMDQNSGDEGVKEFIIAYSKEYGHNPENAFAALGYDTMRLMADAIGRAGSTDPKAIQKAIQDTKDFRGVTGNISYANGGHVPQKSVTIVAVKGGRFTLGAEIVPEKFPAP
jgi:branched-chain amino acid transport system substrate-binding protein